ncbi:DUF5363 family protein [Pasteurella sp. PK-2025]|uniref:DUF5363 family protein n=1 Tax=unclassified Pasteurella TaxID=2621516 RepID=UPI003C7069D1
MEQQKKKSVLRRAWEAYNQFCREIGVERGGGRGCCCVPVVKFDEDWTKEEKAAMKAQKEKAEKGKVEK